jgi:hypothetical protein
MAKEEKIRFSIRYRYAFIISLIFAFAYFFIVTAFFQGWEQAKLFDATPDIIFIIIALNLMFYGFKLRKGLARGHLVRGALLLTLQKLIEIPLQEYQAIVGTLDVVHWVPSMLLGIVGFFSILLAFKEEIL